MPNHIVECPITLNTERVFLISGLSIAERSASSVALHCIASSPVIKKKVILWKCDGINVLPTAARPQRFTSTEECERYKRLQVSNE